MVTGVVGMGRGEGFGFGYGDGSPWVGMVGIGEVLAMGRNEVR